MVGARGSRRRIIVVGGVVPVAIGVAASALVVAWLPELPNPIAIHWGVAGPDGYGSVWSVVLLLVAMVSVFAAVAVGSAWRQTPSGRLVRNQKILLVASVWLSVLLSVGMAGSVAGQRGLTHASHAPDIGLVLLLGALLGFVLAAVAWIVLPQSEPYPLSGRGSESVEMVGSVPGSDTVPTVWSRTVHLRAGVLGVLAVVLILAAGSAVYAVTRAPSGAGFVIAVPVVILFALVGTSFWRITADGRGLTVCSILGWPRVVIPVEKIGSVTIIDVNPMADFGGWGWRFAGDGRSGIIMRAGRAIEVTRTNGKRFVVTVDDAKAGATVLAAQKR
ncbi:MAG: DUF1648 domain-containing protein [Nakamurella sp.]